jgi:DNA replication and repair protein RecF
VQLDRFWLADFRNYTDAEVAPAPTGITVVVGRNGEGKTNLLEAVGYLATLKSFRGAPGEALIRNGVERAIVRGELTRDGRRLLIEAELRSTGRDRVQLNRQAVRRVRDLQDALHVTVFAPDDLVLVKGGPQHRREYLDDLLVSLHPRHDAVRSDVERILRQRNALLKQAGGRLSPEIVSTLDVWDAKLASAGSQLAASRETLIGTLQPKVTGLYDQLAERSAHVTLVYQRSWAGPLADALADARQDDVRRAITTVGPHRDDVALCIGELPSRTHASQGEQRSLALALRLAGHDAVSDVLQSPPVLLLDDVFSELDPDRSEALLACLPAGQALLTTAAAIPPQANPALVLKIEEGKVLS